MMITEDEITKIFCMADDFCKIYDKFIKANGLGPKRDRRKREYHRAPRLSDSEVITIMILFHFSGYRCLKHFYVGHVCSHMLHLFPRPVSYNRFTELEKKVAVPLILFLKKCSHIFTTFSISDAFIDDNSCLCVSIDSKAPLPLL